MPDVTDGLREGARRDGAPEFSVVICTRGRTHEPARAIASALAQEYPDDLYELVVVDNNPYERTRQSVEKHAASTAVRVSYLHEQRPGVSAARNVGADLASREYVAFLDDDAVAGPGWLAAFAAAIRERRALVVGGRVDPVPEAGSEAPEWFGDHGVRGLFGVDHGPTPGRAAVRVRWPAYLGGGNTVYARWLFRQIGGFRTDLSPVGNRRRPAGDIFLNLELELAGVPIYYAHAAAIEHVLTAARLTPGYVWRRTYWSGVSRAVSESVLGRDRGRGSPADPRALIRAARSALLAAEPQRTIEGRALAYGLGYLSMRSRLALARQRGYQPYVPRPFDLDSRVAL